MTAPPRAPLCTAAGAAQAFATLQASAAAHGIALRTPPAEPATCCGRGCNGCVWEGFYAAATWWCEEADAALACRCGPAAAAVTARPKVG